MTLKNDLIELETAHETEITSLLNVKNDVDGLETRVEVNSSGIAVRMMNPKYFWSSEVISVHIRRKFDGEKLEIDYNHGSGGELDLDSVILLKMKMEVFGYAVKIMERARETEKELICEINRIEQVRRELRKILTEEKEEQERIDRHNFFLKSSNDLKVSTQEIHGIDELMPGDNNDYKSTFCQYINRDFKKIEKIRINCDTYSRISFKFNGAQIKRADLEKMIEAGELYYGE